MAPKAWRDIRLFDGAIHALQEMACKGGPLEGVQVAVASRTNEIDWAWDLLEQFELSAGGERTVTLGALCKVHRPPPTALPWSLTCRPPRAILGVTTEGGRGRGGGGWTPPPP